MERFIITINDLSSLQKIRRESEFLNFNQMAAHGRGKVSKSGGLEMVFSKQAFAGAWDVYAGPMHSVLFLYEDGSYRHSLLDNIHHHWGNWDLEDQNGTAFLVLHLQDAAPRMELGPFGWQPVNWPAFEAWPIMQVDANHIFSYIATMMRQNAALPAHPPYAAAPAPLPMPESARFSTPERAPPPAIAPAPAPTISPPQPVMQQWAATHETWDQVRKIYAQTMQQDMTATREINDMYAAQNAKQLASSIKNTQAMSDAVHEGAQAFIASLRKR